MAKSPEPTADPSTYPKGGTFGRLLKWHLEVWGTRPGCSTDAKNKPWVKSHFAQFIHGEGATLKSAEKNLQNWTNRGKLPELHHQDRVDGIYRELFGDDPNLQRWKADLERALEQGRKEQAARIAKREIAPPQGIPRPTAHFVGRDEDVESLAAALISDDGQSAVLVQGGPGIGKTELTKALAHHDDVAARFAERRYFVPLETAMSAAAMQDAIIRAIGCDPQHGFQVALSTLRDQQTLLILDNLETPWEPTDEREATEGALAELSAVPGVALLASIRGAHFVGRPRWNPRFLKELSPTAAADLFASIAGAWVRNDPHLTDFMGALGGLPLAVDLVARRAHGRTSLAPVWREWLTLGAELAAHPDFGVQRLSSLPHSIELSLQSKSVTPPAKRLFGLLGLLPAGLSENDCSILLGEDAFRAQEILCKLGLVVEREGRIDLLPPLREHARRRYRPPFEDLKNTVARYVSLASGLDEQDGQDAFKEDLLKARLEFRNIEVALSILIDQPELAQDSIKSAIKGFGWSARMLPMSTHLLSKLATHYRTTDDLANAAGCFIQEAHLHAFNSNHRDAISRFEEALGLYRRLGDKFGEAVSLEGIGSSLTSVEDFDAALVRIEEAAQLFSEISSKYGEAACLFDIGIIHERRSSWGLASEYISRSANLSRELGDGHGEANCTQVLGVISLSRGDYQEAETSFKNALSIYRDNGTRRGQANCIKRLGDVSLEQEQYESAELLYSEAEGIYREIGSSLGEAHCIFQCAEIRLLSSDILAARNGFESALRLYSAIVNRRGIASCAQKFAEIELKSDRLDRSNAGFKDALVQFRQIEDLVGEANCLFGLGGVECARGNSAQAQKFYEQSLSIFNQIDDPKGASRCLEELAKTPPG